RFRVPGYGTRRLSNSPWRAAVTLVVKRAVVWPAGFLRRPLKVDIANVHPGDQGHTERLNSAVEVLVIHGIFVMPHAGSWVSHFVTHKPNHEIANVHPGDQGHTERLNSAVEVLVIHGIFVMPHAGSWVSHFVTHKPNPE